MSLRKLALIALLTLAPIPSLAQRGNNGVSSPSSGGGATINATNNKLPRRTSATAFGDSAISDDGTKVTSTEPINTPAGVAGTPAIDLNGTHTGFHVEVAGNTLGIDVSGVKSGSISNGSLTNAGKAFVIDTVCLDFTNVDLSLKRLAASVLGIGVCNNAASAGGVFKSAQTLQVNSANFTTSATTLATAGVITGLNFTAPTSFASNWSFQCDITYSQATAAAANLWGVITAGTAPTSLHVRATVLTSNANAGINGTAIITTATSTTVATATPSAFGAIGTTADMFQARISGTVEAPSNATPSQIGIAVASGSASDALTIYRGSSCWWY